MNNFITNIKNHKFIALGCLGVLLVLIVIVIIVSVNNNGTSDAPEKSAASEQTVYFEDTDHPVYISFVDNSEATGIQSVDTKQVAADDDNWYTLQGVKLDGKPTEKGIYIYNGKKVAIK